eukprot:m.196465 g.196465  ORF g.196465 m.196465 type:complete len:1130 (-) comp17013_c0_seq2:57-3446(-)
MRSTIAILAASLSVAAALEWNESCSTDSECFGGQCVSSDLLPNVKRCNCRLNTQQVGPDCRAGIAGVAVAGSIVSLGEDLIAFAGRGFSVVLYNVTSRYDQRVLTFPLPPANVLDGGTETRTLIITVGPVKPYLVLIESFTSLLARSVPLWDWKLGVYLGSIPIQDVFSVNSGTIAASDHLYLGGLGASILRINLHDFSDQTMFRYSVSELIFSTIQLSPLENVVAVGAGNGTIVLLWANLTEIMNMTIGHSHSNEISRNHVRDILFDPNNSSRLMLAHERMPIIGLGSPSRTMSTWYWDKKSSQLRALRGSEVDINIIKSMQAAKQDPNLILATGAGNVLFVTNWQLEAVQIVPLPGVGNNNPRFILDLDKLGTLIVFELPGGLRRVMWENMTGIGASTQDWLIPPGDLQISATDRKTACFQRSLGVVKCYNYLTSEILPNLHIGTNASLELMFDFSGGGFSGTGLLMGIDGEYFKVSQAFQRGQTVSTAFEVTTIARWDAATNTPCMRHGYYNQTQQSWLDVHIPSTADAKVEQNRVYLPAPPEVSLIKCWANVEKAIYCFSNYSCSLYDGGVLQGVIDIPGCEVDFVAKPLLDRSISKYVTLGCRDGRTWWLQDGNLTDSYCLFQPGEGYSIPARTVFDKDRFLIAFNTSQASLPPRQEVWIIQVQAPGYSVLGAVHPFLEPVVNLESHASSDPRNSRIVFVGQHGIRRFELASQLKPNTPTIPRDALEPCRETTIKVIWLPSSHPPTSSDTVEKQNSNRTTLIVVAVLAIVLLSLVLFAVYRYRQTRIAVADAQYQLTALMADAHAQFAQQHPQLTASEGSDQTLAWVEQDRLTLGKVLGEGVFGKVYAATVKETKGQPRNVAVKMVHNADANESQAMLQEAMLLNALRSCEQLVQFHALTHLQIDYQSCIALVLELAPLGNLRDVLRTPSVNVSEHDQTTIAMQVAKALHFLALYHVVHRDVAARNVLVFGRQPWVVKLGDFGLARHLPKDHEYYRQLSADALPYRWMAPEALMFSKTTHRSDIFSFGVLLWELATRGQRPYESLTSLHEVMSYLKSGKRLVFPEGARAIERIAQGCWRMDPKDRLSVPMIMSLLQVVHGPKPTETRATSTMEMTIDMEAESSL